MALDWSDDIIVAHLEDEPALSDELGVLADRVGAEPAPPHAVLDFREVGYINSSNIAQLLRLRRALSDKGCQLRLCSVNDDVMSVLHVTGLDRMFEFSPDTLTALASLQIAAEDDGA
jgi:anti-anti-sigma factor